MADTSSTTNAALLIGLALNATMQAQKYQQILAQAAAEGRDVTDAELAAARAAAASAVDALVRMP